MKASKCPFKFRLFALLFVFGMTPNFLLYAVDNPAYPVNTTLSSQTLVANILNQQLAKASFNALSELAKSNQDYAESWLGGELVMNLNHESDLIIDNSGIRNWQLGLSVPVQMPAKRQALSHVASSYQGLIPAKQNILDWQASGLLRQLVWDLVEAQEKLNLAKSALEQSQLLGEKINQKVLAGESPQIDALLIQKQVLERENEINLRRSQLQQLRGKYQLWTQAKALPFDYVEEAISASPSQSPNKSHPKLLYLQQQMQLLKAEYGLQQKSRLSNPVLSFGAKRERDQSNRDHRLFLEVSIPIQAAPSFSVEKAKKVQEIALLETQIAQLKLQLQNQIEQALQQLDTAKSAINVYEQQLALSKQALAMSEQAYQLGEENIQSLLVVQKQYLDSKGEYALAKIKLGKAIASLNQAMGQQLGAKQDE